jgi:hypothetical protein
MPEFNNDFERIQDLLARYEVQNNDLAMAILQLFIEIAGRRLQNNEGVKASIYKNFLEKGMVKPEFYKEVYQLMQNAEEKTKRELKNTT